MGSWANSLHVRHTDVHAVADAVRALARSRGYRLQGTPARWPVAVGAGEGIDESDGFGEEAGARGIAIYQPVEGWAGVLDSGDISELAHDLSARLNADALLVMVNDSDSWLYELYRNGNRAGGFNSAGDDDDDDDGAIAPELEAAMRRGDENEVDRLLQQELLANAPQGPIVMHDGSTLVPPEIGLLRQRIRNGQASVWERLRYHWLSLRLTWRLFSGVLRPGGLRFGFDMPGSGALSGADLTQHITQVRSFFPQASEATLRRLLPQNRFPAEDLLADFLATLGLPPLYAQLSYGYLRDFSDGELAEASIIRAVDLRFEAV